MSEASYLIELREAAPSAPERLHALVRELPAAQPRAALRIRPALSAAIAFVLVVAVGGAIIGGLVGTSRNGNIANYATSEHARSITPHSGQGAGEAARLAQDRAQFAPSLTASSRLQRQNVSMNLRVNDLSGATQSAVRTTRRLGGFVANADYSTDTNAGDSRLTVRIPVQNLQKAIASFTQLGTILSQHISVADLQGGVDRLDKRIATARRNGNTVKAQQLLRRRAALVREGTYATVALDLTTTKPAAKHVVPSRFDRFWDNASDILGKELIAVLYALVIAGPFVLLAAAILLAERARRRRADDRLLGETG
jgi:multisubunit Na+/H+ antiporter MnhB subunit